MRLIYQARASNAQRLLGPLCGGNIYVSSYLLPDAFQRMCRWTLIPLSGRITQWEV